ncbi:MAG: hypothetical protein KC547_06995 [Anaerolineae bacterium]|nr:hypothetical protein [Anaerolineae bacterium]
MIRYVRPLLGVIAIIQLVFASAYIFQIRAFTQLWPLPYTNTMSFIFIGSIAAAAVASTLWCVAAREDAGVAGIALDYITIFTPISIFALQLAGRSTSSALTLFAVLCIAGAVFGVGLLSWSLRRPEHDPRPAPRLVRWSFVFFVIALIIAGGQMVLKNTGIMPWQISTDATVIYGWMFLGAAAYFAYGVLRPGWYNAGGQLAGFLAYDVVLIIPFLQRLSTVEPELRLNLIIYIMVLVFSGLLAIYYLFIHPSTRMWRPARPAAPVA